MPDLAAAKIRLQSELDELTGRQERIALVLSAALRAYWLELAL